jgi:hypothetical protein
MDGGAVFSIFNGSSVAISGATFTDNFSAGAGAALSSADASSFLVFASQFRHNRAVQLGGAVFSNAGALRFEGCAFDSNGIIGGAGAQGTGSAVYCGPSVEFTLVINSSFTNNFANINSSFAYGSLYSVARRVNITDSIFANNTAYYGAAVYCGEAPSFSAKNSKFIGNSAFRGGAMVLDARGPTVEAAADDQYVLDGNVFESNSISVTKSPTMSIQAGALHVSGGSRISLLNTLFRWNTADARGSTSLVPTAGAANFFMSRSTFVRIIGCRFVGNTLIAESQAQAFGSALRGTLFAGERANFEIRDSIFQGNVLRQALEENAYKGGAVVLVSQIFAPGLSPFSATIVNCSFTENRAPTNPAIFFFGVNWQLKDSSFSRNAGGSGTTGAAVGSTVDASQRVYVSSSVENCTFEENSNEGAADQYGTTATDLVFRGDFCTTPGATSFHDVTFIGDSNFRTQLSAPRRLLANIQLFDCAQLILSPPQGANAGAPALLPTVLLAGGAILNATGVTASVFSLYSIPKAGAAPIANQILIGPYDLTLGPQGLHLSVTATYQGIRGLSETAGSVVLNGLMEIGTGNFSLLDVVMLVHTGSLRYFDVYAAVPFKMQNSRILVDEGGEFLVAYFVNPSYFRGTRNSSIEVHGSLTIANAIFDSVNLYMFPSATVRYIVLNFWPYTTMQLVGGSVGRLEGTTFRFDFTFINPTTALSKNQVLVVANSTSGSLVTAGLLATDVGGFSVEPLPATNSSFSVKIVGFYPAQMRVADSGASLDLTFPMATNSPASKDCRSILSTATLLQLSDTVECGWKSDLVLSVRTSAFPTNVSLVPGAIWDKRDNTFISEIPIKELVLPPKSPLAPVLNIAAPKVHPACAPLVLDATGSYYVGDTTLASYKWALESQNDTHPVALALLNQRAARVVIPSSLLTSEEVLVISLKITNSFGRSSFGNITVTISGLSYSVSIEGPPSRASLASLPVRLYGILDVPSGCNISSNSIYRQWSVSGDELLRPIKADDFSLEIPSSAMRGGQTYTFTFSAWPLPFSGQAVSRQVNLTALPSPMAVSLSGAGGLINIASPAQITPSLFDPDMLATNSSVSWRWKVENCAGITDFSLQSLTPILAQSAVLSSIRISFNSSQICRGPDGTAFDVRDRLVLQTRALNIPANAFGEGEVIFSVTATDSISGRSSGAILYLNYTSAAVPLTIISISSPSSDAGKILPQEKLVLKARFSESCVSPPNVRFQWRFAELGKAIPTAGTHL